MTFTAKERASFARHENEQRRHEAALSFADRLAMLAQMQRVAALFGHDPKPGWATVAEGDLSTQSASSKMHGVFGQ